MGLPPRFASPTQLDVLRTLLSTYSDGDELFQAQFEKSLLILRQLALPELGLRLASPATPPGLRRRILEGVTLFDWPEWDRHLLPMLLREEDSGLFEEGCRALGGLCTRGAMDGLLQLRKARPDEAIQEILEGELLPYRPEGSYESCLDALMEGQGDPVVARRGARGLAARSGPDQVEGLMEAFHLGDFLARHLILKIVAGIQGQVADTLLLALFHDARFEVQECGPLGEFLETLDDLHGKAQRERLLSEFEAQFKACPPELLRVLREIVRESNHLPPPSLELLRGEATGPLKAFLYRAMEMQIQGRSLGFGSLIRNTLGSLASIESEYLERVDDIAGLLAAKADQKQLPLEQVLSSLEEAFLVSAGGQGLLVAYLRLLSGSDQGRLDRILAEPDVAKRKRCIEILGAREENALAPFFIKAMHDPEKEAGQLAIHQLGKLPSGLPGMMELFRSDQPDRIREAIHFFEENRIREAIKPLMGFLASEAPDDLLVDAANALGAIGDPASMNALLRQLHAGKPLVLQVALIEALSQMRSPAACLGLLKKSEELTLPEVLLLVLKASLSAFPGFEQPFPPDQLPAFEKLVDRCCDAREGAGQWQSALVIVQDFYAFNAGVYHRLIERFTAFLVELRLKPFQDRKSQDQISGLIKQLSRRVAKLSSLEEREKALQDSILSVPPTGPKRIQALFYLQELLGDTEHTLGEASAKVLVDFVARELRRPDLEFSEIDCLCRIAGLSGQRAMVEILEDLYAHARTLQIGRVARRALQALGLSEEEIDGRKPIRTILLLEPNAFFRNRLMPVLEGTGRSIRSVATRKEAEAALSENSVDLLISESLDGEGDLRLWFEELWQQRRWHYMLLSTANHDLGSLAQNPWVIGKLYKPYVPEDLVRIIEG
jgi:hypothetical protein